MNKPGTNLAEQADHLIYTSIYDMRASLQCSWSNRSLSAEVLSIAIKKAEKMGEKTRVKVLKSFLRRIEKK